MKTKNKTKIEHERFESDRIRLVSSANTFIFFMHQRQFTDTVGDVRPDLTDQESAAYNSALRLLESEFDRGPSLPGTFQKVVENESESDSRQNEGKQNGVAT